MPYWSDPDLQPVSTPLTHSTRDESHPHSSHYPTATTDTAHAAHSKTHIADGKVRPHPLRLPMVDRPDPQIMLVGAITRLGHPQTPITPYQRLNTIVFKTNSSEAHYLASHATKPLLICCDTKFQMSRQCSEVVKVKMTDHNSVDRVSSNVIWVLMYATHSALAHFPELS